MRSTDVYKANNMIMRYLCTNVLNTLKDHILLNAQQSTPQKSLWHDITICEHERIYQHDSE